MAAVIEALVLDAESKAARVQSIPMPEPGPGEVLVKVYAMALNLLDALYTFNPLGASGRVVGTDFAWTVIPSSLAPRVVVWELGRESQAFYRSM